MNKISLEGLLQGEWGPRARQKRFNLEILLVRARADPIHPEGALSRENALETEHRKENQGHG